MGLDWISEKWIFGLAVIFYGLSALYSIFLHRQGYRQDNRLNYWLVLAAFIPHTTAMAWRGWEAGRCPINNIYEMTVFVMWTMVAAYLIFGAAARFRHLGAFASPFILAMGIFALMPKLDTTPELTQGWVSLHATLILLSYGAFGLASVSALMFLTQEHDLKFHKLRAALARLPSIERLELVSVRMIYSGFTLLSLGLLSGIFWLKNDYGVYFTSDPKVIWTWLVWAIYLGLIIMRSQWKLHGRKFSWGAVGSFLFVLLTFWGFNLLSSIHHR